MKTLKTGLISTGLGAALLLLGGCVYDPYGYVRSDGYYGDAYYGTDAGGYGYYDDYYGYYGPGYGYGPGYFWGPAFGLGLGFVYVDHHNHYHNGHNGWNHGGGNWGHGGSWGHAGGHR